VSRRREFITLLGGAAAWPLVARAQHPAMSVIGYLGIASREEAPARFAGLRQGLKEASFVEGQNVTIEYRPTGDQYGRFSEFAADLVRHRVDVIFASDNVGSLAAKAATATIPIVFAIGGDPVALGLVASFNRPGGNITGVSFLSTTIMAKRLELLHEAVPRAAVVAALINPTNTNAATDASELQRAARSLGLQLHILNASSETEIDDAFSSLVQLSAGALVIEGDAFLAGQSGQLAALAARHRIAAIFPDPEKARVGGLMTYGASISDAYRIAGVYAGRILKGEKPADLPVQQSTKIDFVINLKTTKLLGIELPPTLLALADEVIE
jgi:putative tryptophan/tyrosine transport system substrate-binding protein